MRHEGDNVILTRKEFDDIQEALRKRTQQMKGQLPAAPPPPEPTSTEIQPPSAYYCPTCDSFRPSAQQLSAGYVGDCYHRVWDLQELLPISARQKMVRQYGELKQKYEVAIANVRQANDQIEDQRVNAISIMELTNQVQSLREQIGVLTRINADLQHQIRSDAAQPFRAGRNVNL